MKPTLFLLATLLGLSQCKKKAPDPLSQLPSATQTGANTFGCLVNGQVWTPLGFNGTSNYSVSYDPTYRKGTLSIGTYRYLDTSTNTREDIKIYSDSMQTIGKYTLTLPNHQEALFYDRTGQCKYVQNGPHYRKGTLTITRLDLKAGIISGTFSFTLYKSGCDSIRVTQGRFDKQL
jgi:hypothetical protein